MTKAACVVRAFNAGSTSTKAKAAAARINGAKGGRPRKCRRCTGGYTDRALNMRCLYCNGTGKEPARCAVSYPQNTADLPGTNKPAHRDYTYYRERRRELDRKRPGRSNYDLARERIRDAVRRAVKRGDIVKPKACQRCRKKRRNFDAPPFRLSAHHDDHAKPLDVLWLCPACHTQRHVELRRLGKKS